jgi:hypothetical protein
MCQIAVTSRVALTHLPIHVFEVGLHVSLRYILMHALACPCSIVSSNTFVPDIRHNVNAVVMLWIIKVLVFPNGDNLNVRCKFLALALRGALC